LFYVVRIYSGADLQWCGFTAVRIYSGADLQWCGLAGTPNRKSKNPKTQKLRT
jgi:hypothetical protein